MDELFTCANPLKGERGGWIVFSYWSKIHYTVITDSQSLGLYKTIFHLEISGQYWTHDFLLSLGNSTLQIILPVVFSLLLLTRTLPFHHLISPTHVQVKILSMTKLEAGSFEPNWTPSLGMSLKGPILARILNGFNKIPHAQYPITLTCLYQESY